MLLVRRLAAYTALVCLLYAPAAFAQNSFSVTRTPAGIECTGSIIVGGVEYTAAMICATAEAAKADSTALPGDLPAAVAQAVHQAMAMAPTGLN